MTLATLEQCLTTDTTETARQLQSYVLVASSAKIYNSINFKVYCMYLTGWLVPMVVLLHIQVIREFNFTCLVDSCTPGFPVNKIRQQVSSVSGSFP